MTPLPSDIDVAFNEAQWLGIELNAERREVALGFLVLTLPEGEGGDGSATVRVTLGSVARFAVSLRLGVWNDDSADVQPVEIDQLPATVESFQSQPVYGWEFFDRDDGAWADWRDRLSLDVQWATVSSAHSLTLFQEGFGDRHLDFRVWFNDLSIYDPERGELDLNDFAAAGRRWWDAMRRSDPRTGGSGIVLAGDWDTGEGA